MKKYYLALPALLLGLCIYSCKKNAVQVIATKIDASTTAQIKYFNFGVNSPSVNFYANNVKVSGISSATGLENTVGTLSGSVFPASNYSYIAAGKYTIKAQIPSTATVDANAIIASVANASLENGKYYSLYTNGIYNITAKTTDAFIIEDKIPALDTSKAYVRFVNTIPNATSSLSLYAKDVNRLTETAVATNIAYTSASEFVPLPVGIYELYARNPATPTVNLISRNGTTNGSVSFVGGKVYTIGARGDITVTSTTATNRPLLDNTANR